MTLSLYSYFRSSAAFRVRIALELKGVPYRIVPVNLLEGEQRGAAYRERNPQGFVPALALPDGSLLTQSAAIIEWLEATQPGSPLLPASERERARIRAMCGLVACDIHPLNNLRVLQYLEHELSLDKDARNRWYHHWLAEGFAALEPMLPDTGFCAGSAPGMAECFIVPQVVNAQRFRFGLEPYERLSALFDRCMALPPFVRAHPESQPDRT
jgi:maleylacetoacetate isomerase